MAEYVKKYVPVPGQVVINPCRQEVSNSGVNLILPEQEYLQRGQIVNLWPGAEDYDLDFKRGDMVFFLNSNAVEVPYMETTHVIVPVDKLIGKE